jgi:hypothetical protein
MGLKNRGYDLPNSNNIHLLRRQFLGLAATGAFVAMCPGLAVAVPEEWEEGDPLCRVPYAELASPDGYELDAAFFKSFVELSETLTGVAPLNGYLASQFMERYALNKTLSATLKKLIDAYRELAPGGTRP